MASWFQSAGLNSAFESLTGTVQSVKESVQDAIPDEHKEFLAKITLNTDEMILERENFREEAERKKEAKNSINTILPWETLDEEREILVEECKEAILELSGREETFFGPYEMPMLNVQLGPREDDSEDEYEGGGEEGTEPPEEAETDSNEDGGGEDPEAETATTLDEEQPEGDDDEDGNYVAPINHMAPSEESLEMLSKLEPLPPLLKDFDLDAHVGLIEKVLKEDPKLVVMQGAMSGGGKREQTFWRNYFFHCAFARYEAGLSIDEIWSHREESDTANNFVAENPSEEDIGDAGVASSTSAEGNNEGETIDFEGTGDRDGSSSSNPQNAEETDASELFSGMNHIADAPDTNGTALTEPSELSSKNGFELLDEDIGVAEDPALDELEAEILRELED